MCRPSGLSCPDRAKSGAYLRGGTTQVEARPAGDDVRGRAGDDLRLGAPDLERELVGVRPQHIRARADLVDTSVGLHLREQVDDLRRLTTVELGRRNVHVQSETFDTDTGCTSEPIPYEWPAR
jgi:hypothetical protein